MQPEMIADYACHTGENPLWHPDEKRVYWVDIPPGRLFRYDPATGQHEMCLETGDAIGGFTLQEDGALLLFMARGTIKRWKDGTLTTIVDEIADERESRFNDVIADPAGRVFCGTMSSQTRPGRLYRLDSDRKLTVVVPEVGTSNGIGFTPDRKRMYYTDTRTYGIALFDYDQTTGAISNRRPFASNPKEEGGPDGMTVDAEGCVWSARWNGSRLVRYSAKGKLLQTVSFPVQKVSSLTFGGPDYADIYVTTAGGHIKDEDGAQAGALFRLRIPGVKGVPEFRSKIR
jgi:D-xylonolactonase